MKRRFSIYHLLFFIVITESINQIKPGTLTPRLPSYENDGEYSYEPVPRMIPVNIH